jgi:hypothetical protein
MSIVPQLVDDSRTVLEKCARSIEQQVHELLSQHPHFRGRTGNFAYEYRQEALIIRGRVPTYYLKQLLQTVLKDLSGVAYIDNQVDVISSDSPMYYCLESAADVHLVGG